MSRPIYEKESDRANERVAAEKFREYLSHTLIPAPKSIELREAPKLYPFDYEILSDGKPWAIVEIKCRKNRRDDYPSYMISLEKIRVLREAAHIRDLPSFLLVSWADMVGYAPAVSVAERGIKSWGGRIDRNDPRDQEAVLYVPNSLFTPVKSRQDGCPPPG